MERAVERRRAPVSGSGLRHDLATRHTLVIPRERRIAAGESGSTGAFASYREDIAETGLAALAWVSLLVLVLTAIGDTLELVRTGEVPALVDGDRDLLAQLFANLIENALRHCTPETAIRCELTSTAEAVTVTVTLPPARGGLGSTADSCPTTRCLEPPPDRSSS